MWFCYLTLIASVELKISSSHVRYINMCLWCCCIPQTAKMPAKWAGDWFGAEGSNPPQSVLTEECLWKRSKLTEAASVAVDLSMRSFWSKKDNAHFKRTTVLLSSGRMSEMFLFYRNALRERSFFNSEANWHRVRSDFSHLWGNVKTI